MRLQRFGLGTMLASALGAALGAGLLYSRSVTGVSAWTTYGAVSGAFLGAALAAGAIRSITWVTTSLGAILPAATLPLNFCDGSVFAIPMVGAILGLVVGSYASAGSPHKKRPAPKHVMNEL